jgi:hypothetical protein
VQPDRDVWQLPRGTFIKVNFDDAYETNSGAWGFIARSDDRSFLLETGFRPPIYYIATNGRTDTRWRGEPLTKQIKDKEREKQGNTKTTKTTKQY